MSFKSKSDVYSIAEANKIVVISEDDGKSVSEVTAQGADGSIVASEIFGATASPSAEGQVCGAVTWAAGAKKLGKVYAFETTHKVALTSLAISTTPGSAPTVSVKGEQVEDGAADGCTYSLPATTISEVHHAQILWSAFEISGAGCHLSSASYTAECSISKAMKEGACLAFDVNTGKLTAQISIKQTGDTAPTLTAGTGWTITSPLTCSNPDADYPTYSATLTKYLTKDVQTVQG